MVGFCRVFTIVVLILFTNISVHTAFSGDSGAPDLDLVGSWLWLGGVTPKGEIHPPENQAYVVSLSAEGRIHMKLETNVVNGTYEVKGSSFKIKPPLMMTMAAWLPDSPAPEFISLMENAAVYFYKDGNLYIDTFADGGTLRFEKVD